MRQKCYSVLGEAVNGTISRNQEEKMKKTLTVMVTIVVLLVCVLSLTACNKLKIVGVYEMTDIKGYMSVNGEITQLTTDLYEYYTLEFKKNGTAIVKSKASGSSGAYVENEATWTEEDGVIKVKTKQNGMTVVEEMVWDDGVITFTSKQSAQGITIDATITFTKKG